MLAKLKAAWIRLAGGSTTSDGDAAVPAVEYKGYRIKPTPYLTNGQYQTAGIIEKEVAGEVKSQRFIRADLNAGKDDAVATTILKAQRIIDERGDNLFS